MMRPRPEHDHLNDHLEKHLLRWSDTEPCDQSQLPLPPPEKDREIEALVARARDLQASPALQVHPDFAQRLEQRMLLHHGALHRQSPVGMRRIAKTRGNWLVSRPLVAYAAMTIVLLCSLLGTSALALAAQTTNPSNPFYTVKKWEQQVQLSLARSPSDQAEVSLQIVSDRLNALANAHGEPYRQTLADLKGQMDTAMQLLKALPAGQDHTHLADDLAALKARARRTLRDALPHLSLSDRLLTTDELGYLGDTVPQLNHATMIFSSPSPTQVTINVAGNNLSARGHVLIDQVLMGDSGTLQNETDIFIVNWNGQSSPHTIGILNPDGTVAQTAVLLFSNAKSNTNSKSTQRGNTNGNTHANNSSNGANANKPDGKSQNANPTGNGSTSHGHKNNAIPPSP